MQTVIRMADCLVIDSVAATSTGAEVFDTPSWAMMGGEVLLKEMGHDSEEDCVEDDFLCGDEFGSC